MFFRDTFHDKIASDRFGGGCVKPGGITILPSKETLRLRKALSEIANGDAYFDGPVKFIQIARDALLSSE